MEMPPSPEVLEKMAILPWPVLFPMAGREEETVPLWEWRPLRTAGAGAEAEPATPP
jgi:hypothetical protein